MKCCERSINDLHPPFQRPVETERYSIYNDHSVLDQGSFLACVDAVHHHERARGHVQSHSGGTGQLQDPADVSLLISLRTDPAALPCRLHPLPRPSFLPSRTHLPTLVLYITYYLSANTISLTIYQRTLSRIPPQVSRRGRSCQLGPWDGG